MTSEELKETLHEVKNKYKKETNVCQRHGRCGPGCIAESRHTLSDQLYSKIKDGAPLDIHPLCEVLDIGEISGEHDYKILCKIC